MKIRFMSLASGSSGNCYYIGTEQYGILIDAGISVRSIKKTLKEYNVGLENIMALFVTHDHADHIKAVGALGEKYHIPVYSTALIHKGINRSYAVTEKLYEAARVLEKQVPLELRDFVIEAFEVPHDGTDNVGYSISFGDKKFVFLTDLGEITPLSSSYIQQADYLVIEANYDKEMLRMGKYPQYLKERIASPNGHMSNQDTAAYLSQNCPPMLKHCWLCHLSKDNNHPDLTYKTFELAFKDVGIQLGKTLELTVLKRTTPSDMYFLE